MPDIDAEVAGILIEDGCDPLTAVAGSIRGEPPNPRNGRRAVNSGMLIGLAIAFAAILWRLL